MLTYPHMNPVFLKLGPLEFRWYGLMYIFGFLAGYFLIYNGAKKKGLPLDRDGVADLIFSLAVGVILGGRLGYVLFYNLSYYLEHPLKVFAVWEGGMSFHGGCTGAILAALYFIRNRDISFYQLADIGFSAAPVGLMLGRIGNFINGELYGRVTDVPWGMVFPGGGDLPRHPSQLYEAFLEGPVMFGILYLIGRKAKADGVVFWSFIALYGLFRFLVEFVREPDAQIGYLLGIFSMGQLLSFPMFLLGAGMAIHRYRRGARQL
ncbi:prolipoprotein diacylglyceryl transferase [Geomonas sp.]|uniref:prolipoprotein diacylglyceryl transferase n=1 Tax=Geomonas sp. TaxID=2651584 RepID=UPI002B481C17|nr:prolipoprotein diacylglyceryl transferase [Geomonas sp.]HJV35346.1 prolipoprotein diacylglyceryl transferase [Geomonas sp.]